VRAGRLQEAHKTTTEIEHHPNQITFLARLAEEQAKAGDQAGAKKSIKLALQAASLIKTDQIGGESVRDRAYYSIGNAQASIGDLDGAIKTTKQIGENSSYKSFLLDNILQVQLDKGDIKGALETSKLFQDKGPDPNYILHRIGWAQAHTGDFQGALETAKSINDNHKTYLLDQIAVAQVKSGDWASATKTYDQARSDGSGHPLMGDLIEMTEAQAARGQAQVAYQWAINQKSPRERALALIGVARGMEKSRQSKRTN
jgi:tetratricopeptide (TPR) repeat protein